MHVYFSGKNYRARDVKPYGIKRCVLDQHE